MPARSQFPLRRSLLKILSMSVGWSVCHSSGFSYKWNKCVWKESIHRFLRREVLIHAMEKWPCFNLISMFTKLRYGYKSILERNNLHIDLYRKQSNFVYTITEYMQSLVQENNCRQYMYEKQHLMSLKILIFLVITSFL